MTASHMISYDLIKRKNYPELIAALEAYPYWHCLGSTWIIKTDESCKAVRDSLLAHIDEDDKLLVVKLTGEAAWTTSFDSSCQSWLRDELHK